VHEGELPCQEISRSEISVEEQDVFAVVDRAEEENAKRLLAAEAAADAQTTGGPA